MESLRTVVAVLVAALVAGVATPAFHDQDIGLQYQWVEGEQLTYRITRDSYVRESCGRACNPRADWPESNERIVRDTLTEERRFTVEEVAADGTASVQVLLDSVKLDMQLPGWDESYDSALSVQRSSGAAQLALAMEAVVGEALTAAIDPTGTVAGVSDSSDIWEPLPAYNINVFLSWTKTVKQLASPRAQSGTLGEHFSYLPPTAVALGDSWQTQGTMLSAEFPRGATISNTLTLESLEIVDGYEIARMGLTQSFSVIDGGPMGLSGEVSDVSGEGEILFDRTRGRISRVTSQMRMALTKPTGLIRRTQVNTKTTVELIER